MLLKIFHEITKLVNNGGKRWEVQIKRQKVQIKR